MKKICKCGCGQEIKIRPWHKQRGIPDYVKGHYWNGKKRSAATNEKLSNSSKGRICYWKGKKRPDHSNWLLHFM